MSRGRGGKSITFGELTSGESLNFGVLELSDTKVIELLDTRVLELLA
jgi:hypothetical protein